MKLPDRYTAAKKALAAATRIDEVKDIRDKALAMEVYAYQAKDVELVAAATELRKRAERAIGLLIAADRDAGKLAKPPGGSKTRPKKDRVGGGPDLQTLADQGVDIVACMQRWVQQRGNIDTAGELMRAADAVVARIKAALPERFITIHKPDRVWEPVSEADEVRQKTPELFDGYVKDDCVLIRPEAWRRYCSGFDPGEIAKQLQREGVLMAGNDGKPERPERAIGKLKRYYVLKRSSL
jgi:hypothetical protein